MLNKIKEFFDFTNEKIVGDEDTPIWVSDEEPREFAPVESKFPWWFFALMAIGYLAILFVQYGI